MDHLLSIAQRRLKISKLGICRRAVVKSTDGRITLLAYDLLYINGVALCYTAGGILH